METKINDEVEEITDPCKDNTEEYAQEEPMDAKSTNIITNKEIKNKNDCEIQNHQQSELNKAEMNEDSKICEKEDLKKRPSFNTYHIILFVGMICILLIISLIGL